MLQFKYSSVAAIRRFRSLSLSCALFALLGCSNADDVKARGDALEADSCSLNSECEEPLVCAFQRCHIECQASRDCPDGRMCVRSDANGVFVCQLPQFENCGMHSDCLGKQQVCAEDGRCRDRCESEDDCAERQLCVAGDGVCADPPDVDDAGKLVPGDGAGAGGSEKGDAGANDGQGEATTLVLTRAGSSHKVRGIELEVPKGAVSKDVEIRVSEVNEAPVALPKAWRPLGEIFSLTPHGLEFKKRVTLRIPYGESTESPRLAWLDDDDAKWQLIEADFDAKLGFAELQRESLSYYVVIEDRDAEGLEDAGAPGSSDGGSPNAPEPFDCSVCEPGEICQFDRCYPACDQLNECAGEATCCLVDGKAACVATNDDINHCGMCNAACSGTNAVEFGCASGLCEMRECEQDFDDCDGNPDNGCEANLTADTRHCGDCGVQCSEGASCVKGECETGVGAIYAGDGSTCAVRANGRVACWGALLGTQAAAYRPTEISAVESPLAMAIVRGVPSRAYALLENGRVVSFTGDDLTQATPEPVTGATAIAATSEGVEATNCALRESGLIACWGRNTHGQVGTGDTQPQMTPVTVSNINDATAVSTGRFHVCALRGNGVPTCWGYNAFGQLGNGDLAAVGTPQPVYVSTDAGSQAYSDFDQIAAGFHHTCGLRANGDVLCWGGNSRSQLGTDKPGGELVPALVSGLTDVVSVHTHGLSSATCVLHKDKTVSCWGDNSRGQLGNGTTENGATPAKVPGLTGVTALSMGSSHLCALREQGPPRCWGTNNSGQLGDGSNARRLVPVSVANFE